MNWVNSLLLYYNNYINTFEKQNIINEPTHWPVVGRARLKNF